MLVAFHTLKVFSLFCCFQTSHRSSPFFPKVLFGLNYFPFGPEHVGLKINLPFPRPETEAGSASSLGSRRTPSAVHLSVCLFVFPQFAVEKLTELEHWKQELQEEAHTLIDFFCEDKETMKLDECLQIFRDFCIKFNKAVKVRLMAPLFSELFGFSFFFFQTWLALCSWQKGG